MSPWGKAWATALIVLVCGVGACRSAPPPDPIETHAEPAAAPAPEVAAPTPAREQIVAVPAHAAPEDKAVVRALLLDPSLQDETAPERFTVLFQTTKGELHLDVRRSWAPRGADRFYTLVKSGFFTDVAFFRVIAGFAAQAGIHGDGAINDVWRARRIEDDPVTQSNVRGMVSFATSGKNSRTTQFFVNLGDNPNLDAMGFAPIGRVRELDVLAKLHAGYGEGAPAGRGPVQSRMQREGNSYLKNEFPTLDYIEQASISDAHAAPNTVGTKKP